MERFPWPLRISCGAGAGVMYEMAGAGQQYSIICHGVDKGRQATAVTSHLASSPITAQTCTKISALHAQSLLRTEALNGKRQRSFVLRLWLQSSYSFKYFLYLTIYFIWISLRKILLNSETVMLDVEIRS